MSARAPGRGNTEDEDCADGADNAANAAFRLPPNEFIDTGQVRRTADEILKALNAAMYNARMPEHSATRLMIRMLEPTIRFSTVLLCKLLDETRVVERETNKLLELQVARDAAADRAARKIFRRHTRLVVVSGTFCAVCIAVVMYGVWHFHSPAPVFEIAFDDGAARAVHCDPGAGDSDEYHCNLPIVLRHRKGLR